MSFRKIAKASTIGSSVWDTSTGKLTREAGIKTASYFLDGSRVIDFEGLLKKHANDYKISSDPRDYMLEAIRANTSEAPNENDDCFTRSELLSFRTDLGMPVYATYTGKPHHVNHKADDPTRARGIIVDAHYHHSTQPLSDCPQCGRKTAERENRDVSGIFCKCGFLVKDEFPEILLAVDTKKDPAFAKGVRERVLNAGSMGCTCLATECNVCGNVAYNERQFCAHLKPGLKGKIWVKNAKSGAWEKSSLAEVEKAVNARGMKFNPTDFVSVSAGEDFHARKSFEKCLDVVFDEYSRVSVPADPKALSRELLRVASKQEALSLSDETEALIKMAYTPKKSAAAKTVAAKTATKKTAKKFYLVRVDGDPLDVAAAESVERALELAAPDQGSTIEVGEVEAMDAGAARLMKPSSWSALDLPQSADASVAKESDVRVQAPPGEQVIVEPSPEDGGPQLAPDAPGAPGAPGVQAPGAPGPGIEQYTENKMNDPMNGPGGAGETMSPGELGILPPGASKQSDGPGPAKLASTSFEAAYGDFFVEADQDGLAVLTAKEEPVLRIAKKLANKDDALKACTDVMKSLNTVGLVETARAFSASGTAKTAQVLEDGMNDMADHPQKSEFDQITEGADASMLADQKSKKPEDSVLEGGEIDMTEKRKLKIDDTIEGGATDHNRDEVDTKTMKVTDDGIPDTKEDQKTPIKNVLEGGEVDMALKSAGLGSKIAHVSKPDQAWVVIAASFENGAPHITVQNGADQHKLSAQDLIYWRSLEKTAEQAVAEFEAEVKTAYQAKIAEIRKAADEEVLSAKMAALDALERTTGIISRRFAAGLEDLPLRDAIETTLKVAHSVGVDQATGAVVEYGGMSEQLAQVLASEILNMAHDQHIEALFTRSAELMARSEEYLSDAEREVSNLRVAMPSISAAAVHGEHNTIQAALDVAIEKRKQASRGNFVPVTPEMENADSLLGSEDAQQYSLRGALNATRVASRLGQLERLAERR